MFIDGTTDQPEEVKLVSVTVLAAATSGVSSADVSVIGGKIIGIVATSNQDQFVDNVAISATGVVTVTLNAAATADNVLNVSVLRTTGNDA